MSTERVLVQRGASEKLIPEITRIMQSLKAGDPFNDSTANLSALFNEKAAENVLGMIKEAKEEGAEILVGDLKREGGVIQPHLLIKVKPGTRMWERESFGPGEDIAEFLALLLFYEGVANCRFKSLLSLLQIPSANLLSLQITPITLWLRRCGQRTLIWLWMWQDEFGQVRIRSEVCLSDTLTLWFNHMKACTNVNGPTMHIEALRGHGGLG